MSGGVTGRVSRGGRLERVASWIAVGAVAVLCTRCASVQGGTYCDDEGVWSARCVTVPACRDALRSSCLERQRLRSSAFNAAAHDCASSIDCVHGVFPDDPCVSAKLNKATPTAGQEKLAQEFCAACAKSEPLRESGVPIACAGSVVTGEGRLLQTTLLSLGEDVLDKVRSCIAPARDPFRDDYDNCENKFLDCVDSLFAERSPACK